MSNYQDRYLAHQLRKKKTLMRLVRQRHSTRVFAEKHVGIKEQLEILGFLGSTPSSCDRQGIYVFTEEQRDRKALLSGLLVGGVGWLHRAPCIFMLFADPKAYPENFYPMPYLDAGVKIAYIYLLAESLGLKACYVNPNIRTEHQKYFEDAFGKDIFCGAVALGYAEKK